MKDIGREFMRYTRYRHLGPSPRSLGATQPPSGISADRYGTPIKLPHPDKGMHGRTLLADAIEKRTSIREYSNGDISSEELAYLLWCSQGARKIINGEAVYRTVPSAGARHALDTYLMINRIRGMEKGVYAFLPAENSLVRMGCDAEDMDKKMIACCRGQEFAGNCAVLFIWAADIPRMYWSYGERGYRYIHLDAGHICQNLYLACEDTGCGACAIAAFDDDAANGILGLDGEERFAVYMAAVGKKLQP